MKTNSFLGIILSAGLLFQNLPSAYGYLDEVLTSPAEVWDAAVTLLEREEGIKSQDRDKGVLTSEWMEDTVRKEKRMFPSMVGVDKTLASTVRRRSRMRIQLTETATGTQIQITGKFQEKPLTGPPHQVRWEKIKPDTEDYDLERQLFFEILEEISRKRTAQPL